MVHSHTFQASVHLMSTHHSSQTMNSDLRRTTTSHRYRSGDIAAAVDRSASRMSELTSTVHADVPTTSLPACHVTRRRAEAEVTSPAVRVAVEGVDTVTPRIYLLHGLPDGRRKTAARQLTACEYEQMTEWTVCVQRLTATWMYFLHSDE